MPGGRGGTVRTWRFPGGSVDIGVSGRWVCLWVFGAVVTFSEPGAPWILRIPATISTLVLLGSWAGGIRWAVGSPAEVLGRLAVPLLVLATATSVAFDLPLRARWAVSKGQFAEEARRYGDSAAESSLSTEFVGGYLVNYIEKNPFGVVFFSAAGDGLVDDAGFAYLPHGTQGILAGPAYEGGEFVPIGGGWYRWTASW